MKLFIVLVCVMVAIVSVSLAQPVDIDYVLANEIHTKIGIPSDEKTIDELPQVRERREAQNNQIGVSVDRSRQGTNLAAEAQARLWESRNGRSSLDGQANYNQHFGGPAGRQRPNYGAGLTFKHRF